MGPNEQQNQGLANGVSPPERLGATVPPLTPDEVRGILMEVKELIRPDIVTKFHASRPIRQEPQHRTRIARCSP